MNSLHKDIEAMHNSETSGVNEMWENFRDTLQHSINRSLAVNQDQKMATHGLVINSMTP